MMNSWGFLYPPDWYILFTTHDLEVNQNPITTLAYFCQFCTFFCVGLLNHSGIRVSF